jgi:hypothetical protein
VGARDLRFELIGQPDVELVGADEVSVTLTARVPYLFADAFPGLPDSEVVTVTAHAQPVPSSE